MINTSIASKLTAAATAVLVSLTLVSAAIGPVDMSASSTQSAVLSA